LIHIAAIIYIVTFNIEYYLYILNIYFAWYHKIDSWNCDKSCQNRCILWKIKFLLNGKLHIRYLFLQSVETPATKKPVCLKNLR